MDASTQCWGAHMGDSQISGTWTACNSISSVGAQSSNFGPPSLGYSITGHQYYGHYHITGVPLLFPHPVTSSSGSVPMATNSRHSHKDQTNYGLSDCDSGPSISIKSTNINQIRSLQLEIVNWIFRTWGTLTVDMFATVHNMHLPQFTFPILEPRALAIDGSPSQQVI